MWIKIEDEPIPTYGKMESYSSCFLVFMYIMDTNHTELMILS